MEVFRRVVEVLEDDVGTLLHAGLCVDAAGISALAHTKAVVIDQLACILGQSLGGSLVDIPVEGVALVFREPNSTTIDVGSEAFLTVIGIVVGEHLYAIENPLIGNGEASEGLGVLSLGIPDVVHVVGPSGGVDVLGLEDEEGRRIHRDCPTVTQAYLLGFQVVRGGDDTGRSGIIVGVVVTTFRVVHAVVIGVGVVDRLRHGLRVVDGSVDVDHHLTRLPFSS